MTTTRRLLIFIGALVVLGVGGALTSLISAEGATNLIPGVLTVTRHPEASVSQFGGSQGLWFVLMVGFILFNLAGAAATGAAIFWFLSRQVKRAKAENPANHETLRDAIPGLRQRSQPALPAESEPVRE
jgi:hypothetical protein